MAKSQATSSKKDKERKRANKRKDKDQKREERKANSNKGKGFESMMAYVDYNGMITSTPPDLSRKQVVKAEDISIGIARQEEGSENADAVRNGTVTFFNDSKGYGFIKDINTQESIFVHANALSSPIKENDKGTFEVERGARGFNAINVKLL